MILVLQGAKKRGNFEPAEEPVMKTKRLYLICIFMWLIPQFSCIPNQPHTQYENRSLIFIGNSLYGEGIDSSLLAKELKQPVEVTWRGAEFSSWHYAVLCSLLKVNVNPRLIFIPLDYNWICLPALNTTGSFWDELVSKVAGDIALLDTLNYVISNAGAITEPWIFPANADKTFLPRMIALARQSGVQLVFTRMRMNEDPYPLTKYPLEDLFSTDLAQYCTVNNVVLLDYTRDPEIEISDFGYGAHYTPDGRAKWSLQLVEDIKSILASQPAYHQTAPTTASNSPASILTPGPGDTIWGGTPVLMTASKECRWSYSIAGDPRGQIYLGTFQTAQRQIIPFDSLVRAVILFTYDCTNVQQVTCTLGYAAGSNLPPSIEQIPDQLSYLGKSVPLTVHVTDDHRPADTLSFKWELLRGEGQIEGPMDSSAVFVPGEAAIFVIRVSVSDGQYESVMIMRVIVNDKNQFKINSPTANDKYRPGDTVHITWQVVDVANCMIEFSYDAGLTFSLATQRVLTPQDSDWGNFLWTVPDDAPVTNQAIIRLSNYTRTVSGQSFYFRITQ